MDKNRTTPFSSFSSLTFFTGLCIGLTPTAQAADSKEKSPGDTLVVEAQAPSLYAPTKSADPKFSRPIADTTRTVTVISEQVLKDQITDEQQLEQIMDGLCDFCDEIRFIDLYRSLCRHIYYQYPQLVGEHVALFRALFEGPDEK